MRELVIGGSGCGKSQYAEERICQSGEQVRYYIATMEPFGRDGQERIARHQRLRQGKGFRTIEQYRNIGNIQLKERGSVLLECLGNLVANEMFAGGEAVAEKILAGLACLEEQTDCLVVVSNDVARDGLRYDDFTERYIETLGRLNQALAERYGGVTEVVAGIPLRHRWGGKG